MAEEKKDGSRKEDDVFYQVSLTTIRSIMDSAGIDLDEARKKALDHLLAGSPNDQAKYKAEALDLYASHSQTMTVLRRLGLIGGF